MRHPDAERAVHALVVGLMKEGSHFEEREHATLVTGNELLRVNWSLCGALRVKRATYRFAAVRNGATVVPLELEAGLMEQCTPALAKSLQLGKLKGPVRSYLEDLQAAHRWVPPRATAERRADRLASAAHHRIPSIEPILREQERVPKGTKTIALGVDRTSVPIATPTDRKCSRRLLLYKMARRSFGTRSATGFAP